MNKKINFNKKKDLSIHEKTLRVFIILFLFVLVTKVVLSLIGIWRYGF